jgi:hypothetical protein
VSKLDPVAEALRSPYTSKQIASILQCVTTDKARVEKIVVSAATAYVRSLELPPLKRANPVREIAQLKGALQTVLKALSDLSGPSQAFLDSARRDPGSRDPSSHDEITDCKALSNCIHRFLIENKDGLDSTAAGGARPGRPEVNDKRQLLDRLELAFFIGQDPKSPRRGLPKFLTRCAAPQKMKLQNKEGTTNWWDDLRRKKAATKRRG